MGSELVERDVAPGLRRHVQRYYGYEELTAAPTRQREPPSTGVAAQCGYYDQAHMDRDFRDFADTTPTAYLDDPRDRATFVQDEAA